MSIFLKFLASMACLWCGIELVQPQSAFLAFVVFGLTVWLMVEVMLEAGAILLSLAQKGRR